MKKRKVRKNRKIITEGKKSGKNRKILTSPSKLGRKKEETTLQESKKVRKREILPVRKNRSRDK